MKPFRFGVNARYARLRVLSLRWAGPVDQSATVAPAKGQCESLKLSAGQQACSPRLGLHLLLMGAPEQMHSARQPGLPGSEPTLFRSMRGRLR